MDGQSLRKPISLRALNEYCFCPRLYYLMYIDGEFETNNDVEKGTEAHEKAAPEKKGYGR